MNTFSNLLEMIKTFSTASLKDMPIYSRQYFDNILIPIYSSRENFSFVFCDFNKLNKFNKTYSESQANVALENSLEVIIKSIKEHFPDIDFCISRIGGDEFAIIVDSSSIDLYGLFEQINFTLQSDCISTRDRDMSVAPNYLDIAYGVVRSNEFDNIYDIYSKAQEREAENKLATTLSSTDLFDNLKVLFSSNVSKFFNNYRISSFFELSKEQSKKLVTHAVKSISNMVSSSSNAQSFSTSNTSTTYPVGPENSPMSLAIDKCSAIHNYISNTFRRNSIDLSILNMNDLNLLLNNLTRNPVSGFFNRNYFYDFFVKQAQEQGISFKGVSLFDTSGIKDCNTRYGYTETDKRLRKLSNQLCSSFESNCNMLFDNTPFSISDTQNYIFDLGGGNYVVLTTSSISPQLLDRINR